MITLAFVVGAIVGGALVVIFVGVATSYAIGRGLGW